jgi:hypothetical protein
MMAVVDAPGKTLHHDGSFLPNRESTVTPEPLSIVETYLKAQSARDYETMRTLLAAEGFSYRSPIAFFDRAEDFLQYASLSSGIIIDHRVRKVFVDGGDVCHLLTYRIQISEKLAVEVAHWAQVREGRIQGIEVIFDASVYRELFPNDDPAP